ncbi:hypothetical protein AVEN_240986-1 [Araneus ventricosus]|uniref:Uncharacterized protein n=1 Tax=Araneus ventricosus TaxID=182803 RepID=A0A4Y2SIN2_ARAVE|nr:hypothetical protein AVEN_240986-1 [Araneus ventricosus]
MDGEIWNLLKSFDTPWCLERHSSLSQLHLPAFESFKQLLHEGSKSQDTPLSFLQQDIWALESPDKKNPRSRFDERLTGFFSFCVVPYLLSSNLYLET